MQWNVAGNILSCMGGNWDVPYSQIKVYDIYIFTETMLTPQRATLHESTFSRIAPSHTHIRACRERTPGQKGRNKGGLSIFIKNTVPYRMLENNVVPDDVIILSIGNNDILLVACYITPGNGVHHEAYFNYIAEKINSFEPHKDILIMGDLNSRVGILNEYTPPFNFLAVSPKHNNEVVHEDQEFAPAPLRSNKDAIVSQSGKKCMNFCKHLGYII